MKIHFAILLASIFGLSSCQSENIKTETKSSRVEYLPYYNSPDFTAHWFPPNSDSLKNFHSIPDFNLLNQLGDSVSQKDLQGKIYIADFFFTTCPGICPKMTKNMQLVQQAFLEDDEIKILSHSVTPSIDSVPVLKEYAQNQWVNSKSWFLLTGDRNTIYDLGRNAYFIEEDLGLERENFGSEFIHTENFVLVDKNHRLRGIYNGLNKASVNQLIADIKTLKEES
tara:strand:+ start:29546 stop:30220 length:675 start_codon:yes stop_codon:yes gene_type:complete